MEFERLSHILSLSLLLLDQPSIDILRNAIQKEKEIKA